MKKYIDSNSKKNEIRMLLKHPSFNGKIIAVLEGDTDIRLFRSLMDENHAKIETAIGKNSLIEIVSELLQEEECASRLFGICDADFMHILGTQAECSNIFLTDTHDAETMMLNSPAVKALIAEYASSSESTIILTENLIKSALDAAFVIGIYRYINHLEDLNLNFKGLHIDLYATINGVNVAIDVEQLTNGLVERSPHLKTGITIDYLLQKHKDHTEHTYDHMQFCNGHDVTKIISYILAQRELSNDVKMNQDKVERSLRLSYTTEHFKNTELYRHVHNWMETNVAPSFLL